MKYDTINELYEQTPELRFIEHKNKANPIVQCPECLLIGKKVHVIAFFTKNFTICEKCKNLLKIPVEYNIIKSLVKWVMSYWDLNLRYLQFLFKEK